MDDACALRGTLAVVAGATRGAGRGIAAALGEAGATVVCTGRSSSSGDPAIRSDYAGRPETVEQTAVLVDALGGTGVPVQVDHLDPGGVARLADRIRAEYGRIDLLVNDIWVAEENWRDALAVDPATGRTPAPPGFASSESPRYLGRGIAALAADPQRARWNQASVTSADLARTYGIRDVDGTRPDSWADLH